MACDVKINAIKHLETKGAVDETGKILNQELFESLNDQLTELSEKKYSLKTDGGKLFSTNMSEPIDIYKPTYYTKYKNKVQIGRAHV